MNRSAKGERRIISNLAFWPKLVAARREGCNQAIARVLRDAMVTAGEEQRQITSFGQPRMVMNG